MKLTWVVVLVLVAVVFWLTVTYGYDVSSYLVDHVFAP